MSEFITSNSAPLRIDFSNTLLKDTDLFNIHENTILKLTEANGTIVELSDLKVFDYIQNNFNGFQFILSSNAALIHEFDINIINCFCEQQDFTLISLRDNTPIDFEQLKTKNKIEIIIGNQKCNNCNYINQMSCKLLEQNNQIIFSGNSIYDNCLKINNSYMDDNYIFNDINLFKQKGFTHFKIENPCNHDFRIFNRTLIQNLIKPEYVNDCFNFITKEGWS